MHDTGIVVEAEVGCIDKSPTARILARLLRLRGAPVGDLRQFVENAGGEWVPTRAGISLPRERLGELRDLVDRLIQAGSRLGLQGEAGPSHSDGLCPPRGGMSRL